MAKDHEAWKKTYKGSKYKRGQGKKDDSTSPAANVAIPDEEVDSEVTSDEDEDDATAGFSAIFNNNWV